MAVVTTWDRDFARRGPPIPGDALQSKAANEGSQLIGSQAFNGSVEDALITLKNIPSATITFQAEAADKRDVTVQVVDQLGAPLAGVKRVRVASLAATPNNGDIAVPAVLPAAGSLDVISNPATGENVAFATTDNTGKLTLSIATPAAETVGFSAEVTGGATVVTSTTFA